MPSSEHAPALGQRTKIFVIQILSSQRAVPLPRAPLVSQEEIFCDGVGLVPGVGLILAGPPAASVLNGFPGQMRQGGVRRMFENAIRIGIANTSVRIDQSTYQLVVAVGGEAVVLVKISRDRLTVEQMQTQNFFARSEEHTSELQSLA